MKTASESAVRYLVRDELEPIVIVIPFIHCQHEQRNEQK